MKRISLNEYNLGMGALIDLSDPITFQENQIAGSKNIPYQKLMLYYKEYLDKNKPYYLLCQKGLHSSKATQLLEYFGYDVTQVMK